MHANIKSKSKENKKVRQKISERKGNHQPKGREKITIIIIKRQKSGLSFCCCLFF